MCFATRSFCRLWRHQDDFDSRRYRILRFAQDDHNSLGEGLPLYASRRDPSAARGGIRMTLIRVAMGSLATLGMITTRGARDYLCMRRDEILLPPAAASG